MVELYEPLAEEIGVELVSDFESRTRPIVRATANWSARRFSNDPSTHAIKIFGQGHGEHPKVVVAHRPLGGKPGASTWPDSGPGIPEGDMARVDRSVLSGLEHSRQPARLRTGAQGLAKAIMGFSWRQA